MAILFMISAVAEVNRAPFDLPEAESELIGGFFTEHSAISFALFFLGEYTSILVISCGVKA
jgi:NADH-quinone oxidoreductase subunit H